MFDRFDLWQYRDDHNCWDFVREFLIEKAGIDSDDVPKFGICPKNKREMTSAARSVATAFKRSKPVQYSIACQYIKNSLFHVGIVDNGMIRHSGEKTGTRTDTIEDFEKVGRVIYMLHEDLWL